MEGERRACYGEIPSAWIYDSAFGSSFRYPLLGPGEMEREEEGGYLFSFSADRGVL
jgi:hypothetical protein